MFTQFLLRILKISVFLFAVTLSVASVLQANSNKYGFPTKASHILGSHARWRCPAAAGEYQVKHVTEGDNHIMVLRNWAP